MKDKDKTKEQLINELIELRQRINKLKISETEHKKMKEVIKKGEEEMRLSFDNAAIGMCMVDTNARFIRVNKSLCDIVGYSETELLNKTFQDITHPDDLLIGAEYLRKLFSKKIKKAEFTKRYIHKNRSIIWALLTTTLIRDADGNSLYLFTQIQDITKRKQAEDALQKAKDKLDLRVKERTAELRNSNITLKQEIDERKKIEQELLASEKSLRNYSEELKETNAALKVLLKQRNDDKREFEENILSNMKHLILPYIEKLKKIRETTEGFAYLNVLESNVNEIISPFSAKLSSHYLGFTPKEIQIANFIKDGKQDKDIMEMLNISKDTAKTHRQNIRKKLGIYGKKANLRTYLLTSIK